MRTTMTARCLAAVAVLLLAGPARAVDVGGAVGAGYFRADTSTSTFDTTASTWDWFGNVAISGSPFAPGLFDWQLEGGYQGRRDYYEGGSTGMQGLSYRASTTLFGQKGSPLVLRFDTGRSKTEFTSDTAQNSAGTVETTGYSASAYYREEDRPNVSAAFNRVETETRGFSTDRTFADTSRVSVAMAHGAATFGYALNYDLSWNDGTYDSQNYRTQLVSLRGQAKLSPTASLNFSETYYQRRPTGGVLFNPGYDDQSFSAQLNWQPDGRWNSRTMYQYQHFLVEDPTTSSRERLYNGLTESLDLAASTELKAIGLVGYAASEERAAGVSTKAQSAFLTAEAIWSHVAGQLTWQADGSGSIGTYMPEGAAASTSSGVQASVGAQWSRDMAALGASYNFGYQTDLGGFAGWSLVQTVRLDGELHAGDDWRFRGNASASAGRASLSSAGFGTANRQLLLTLGADWRAWSSVLMLGQIEGLSSSLTSPLHGDGLFLAPSYNSTQRYATLSLSPPAWEGLRATLIGRLMATSAPGQPDTFERGFSVSASYAVGAFNLSLEERWSQGGATQVTSTGNLLMARISRSFGARF
jgi:hypothetical protein